MASKDNIFSDEWCDLVFEKRNQTYGAFRLRKLSAKWHVIALTFAVAVFTLICIAPDIIKRIVPEKEEKEVSVRVLSNINIEKPNEKVNEIIKELPPPPPALRNVIKFTAPVIKPDEEVREEEQPKTQQEVIVSKAAIGTINFNKGTNDVTAVIPTTVPQQAQQITGQETQPYRFVEEMPNFPGGADEMHNFLLKHVHYPEMARMNDIQGTVYVEFVVDKDGKIKDAKVLRGIGGGCDEEAIRVIMSMPDWIPGKQNGVPVPVYFNLPVKFTLQSQ
jgi:protein TonB